MWREDGREKENREGEWEEKRQDGEMKKRERGQWKRGREYKVEERMEEEGGRK